MNKLKIEDEDEEEDEPGALERGSIDADKLMKKRRKRKH